MTADVSSSLGELFDFLRIPSISADPGHTGDVVAAAMWVRDFVVRGGGSADIVTRGDRPLVVGEIPASIADAPTVMLYGHFDVQPAGPVDLWETPPFEPAIHGGWLCARGSADDKGQLYLLLRAATELASENVLPVNIRVLCDGEEEILGHSVVDYLAEDVGAADACVIFDADMPARGIPVFYTGVRGLVHLQLQVRSGDRDVHSGYYGGAALNAANALVEILDAVVPRGGDLRAELRLGTLPPDEEELAEWRRLRPGRDVLASTGLRPAGPSACDEFYARTWSEPALDINGLGGGSPDLQKTVLPAAATASLSVRLAAGQSPELIADSVEQLLREATPVGADLDIVRWVLTPAARLSRDEPAIQLGLEAFERVIGTRPLALRSGATLPILSALVERAIPTILTGFAVPDSNIHGPNERLPVEHIHVGLRAARELLLALGQLQPGAGRHRPIVAANH